MSLLDISAYGLWPNVALFAAASGFVWFAGTRLTGLLDAIAGRTGMDRAFMGMLFLGGVTSLPEVAAVSSAAWSGNAPLATNNLLGSVAMNVMLIAVADAMLGRDALTSVVASPATLLQGTICIIVLALVAAAVLTGDAPVFGVGIWSVVLFALAVAGFWLCSRYSHRAPWHVKESEGDDRPHRRRKRREHRSVTRLAGLSVAAGATILVAGFFLSQAADGIARSTGLASGLVGLVVVASATSLPELSSITEAVRRGRYEMALGDVFGTNLLTIALILLADVFYTGNAVLNEAGRFEAVAALLGAVLTGLFLVGLLERQNKTVLRMGYDALAAVVVFPAGLVLLFFLQGK